MSEFKVTKDLQDAINSTTDHETLRALLHEQALAQNVTMAKSWDEKPEAVNTSVTNGFSRDLPERDASGKFVSSNQSVTSGPVSKTETIGGKQIEFSADTTEELNQMIIQAYQVAEAIAPAATTSPAARARHEQEANDAEVMRRTDLELKFKRGQLSTQEFLEQSGAIAEYLNEHGAPLEVLAQTVEQVQSANETQSWEDAVDTFLHSSAANGWPGGERNTELVGLTIQNLGLVNAPDKVAAITQAVNYIRQKEMLFEPEAEVQAVRERAALEEAMKTASSPEEIRAAMENYKSALATRGFDPNEAFVKTFARSGQDATYQPAMPSGERRSSGIFGR